MTPLARPLLAAAVALLLLLPREAAHVQAETSVDQTWPDVTQSDEHAPAFPSVAPFDESMDEPTDYAAVDRWIDEGDWDMGGS